MRSIALFQILSLAGLLAFSPTGYAAEAGEDFSTKAAEAIKKAKAVIKEKGLQEGLREYEAAAVSLRASFPKRPEPWAMLLEVAVNLDYQNDQLQPTRTMTSPDDQPVKVIGHVRGLLTEINKASAAYATTKERARHELARLDRLGKPLSLEFDAQVLDLKSGLPRQEPFNLEAHNGKVVLVHFWSTQSGPCIADLPRLKEARKKHADDLVLTGISLDENNARLRRFLKEKQMDWPQYFDGRGWDNRLASEFGVTSIPTQWLIDRQGNLRSLNARHDLEKKIAVLIAENPSSDKSDKKPAAPQKNTTTKDK